MDDLEKRLTEAHRHLSQKKLKMYVDTLAGILKCTDDIKKARKYEAKFSILIEEFESSAGHTVTNLLRTVSLVDQLSYLDVLRDVADELGYEPRPSSTIVSLEEEIVERFLENLWGSLSDKQKSKMKQIILDTLKSEKGAADTDLLKKVSQSGAPFAAILAGNSAGFSLYIAATSGLHAVAGALGLSLSFGTYTALTTGLSTILGPLGVVAAGVFATYKLGQPSYERKLIPGIMLLTAMRAEIGMAKEKKKGRKKKADARNAS